MWAKNWKTLEVTDSLSCRSVILWQPIPSSRLKLAAVWPTRTTALIDDLNWELTWCTLCQPFQLHWAFVLSSLLEYLTCLPNMTHCSLISVSLCHTAWDASPGQKPVLKVLIWWRHPVLDSSVRERPPLRGLVGSQHTLVVLMTAGALIDDWIFTPLL